MQNLTVSEDNDHLGTFVRGGQQTFQSLKVMFQKDFAIKGTEKEREERKREDKVEEIQQ